MSPLQVLIPVECQNGHKAYAQMEIYGLEAKYLGVPKEQDCACPKHETHQGWRAYDSPVATKQYLGHEALLEAAKKAKQLLIKEFQEPQASVFWALAEAIRRAEGREPIWP